jgi:hypothetical protein
MTDRKTPKTEPMTRLEMKQKGLLDRKNNPKSTAPKAPRVRKPTAPKPAPEAARMPDKKPDNWEVHQTGSQAEFDAAVDAALGAKPRKPTGRKETANSFDDDLDAAFGGLDPRDRDIVTTDVQPARAFRDQGFANANIGLISDYADYRVMGWNPERAFIRVFGTDYGDMHLFARIEALEHNLVYRQVFAKRFGATPLSRMFSVKHAIWHWLSLLNNPFVKETVRAKAIDSLQVIYGITVVDEAGNTKATKSLDDFYRDEEATASGTEGASNPQGFRHPDPGSPEAIAFEAEMRGETTGENASNP